MQFMYNIKKIGLSSQKPYRYKRSELKTLLKTGLISLLVLTIMVLSCSDDENEPTPEDNQQKVQDAVDSVRSSLESQLGNTVPSLNLIIQTPDDVIFVSSVPDTGTPVTRDTYFRFASNTKNFTATAILNMYEDGWLDYEANITDTIPGSSIPYVPDTPEWDIPYKDEITIEQLLQHSAGVYDIDNDTVPGCGGMTYTEYILGSDPWHQFTVDEFAEQLTSKNLYYYAPGSGYHYSNTGYAILSRVIERVYTYQSSITKTYGDYLHDHITGGTSPVQLNAHFPVLATDSELPDPHIYGTVYLPGDITEIYGDCNMSAQVGEGNGYGTLDNLHTYIRTLMQGENVLSPTTVQLMQTDVSVANPDYGLGCLNKENIGYGHNGARIGNLSFMAYDPDDDVSIAVSLPLWDLTEGMDSFLKCFSAMYDAAYAARQELGYPGKPE